jgi:outer membrane protein TolC
MSNLRSRTLKLALLLAGLAAGASAGAGELGDLLRSSLAHPIVAARAAAKDAAVHQLDAARRRTLGAASLVAEATRYEGERFVGVLSPAALTAMPFSRDVSRYGVAYQLPVDLAGAIAAARRAAQGDLEAARLAERQAALLKLHDTISAYVRLQALLHQVQVLKVQRARVEQTIQRVQREVEIGQAALVDLHLAESEQARLYSEQTRLEAAMEEALAALEEASGQRRLPSGALSVAPAWPEGGIESALPLGLAQARAEAEAARAEEARRQLWPAFSLGADYFQFDSGALPSDTWTLSARVSLPIDLAAWTRADAARAQARAAREEREAVRRDVTRQWAALRSAYNTARADAEALRQEIAAREEVVRVQSELLRVGMASLEEFLRQQRDLREAEARSVEARARALIAWSAAQVLLGTSVEHYIDTLDSLQ